MIDPLGTYLSSSKPYLFSRLADSLICLSALLTLAGTVRSDANDQQLRFFEAHIRPILVAHCYECHSGEAEDLMGGLRLDSRQAILRGGDTGAAAIAGNADKSLLWLAMTYHDRDLQMPPDGALPAKVVADFERWINEGMVDPRTESPKESRSDFFDLALRQSDHWAWQPIDRNVKSQSIDRFIAARLAEQDLEPVPLADAATLLRRLSFDLIGLPPTRERHRVFAREFLSNPQAATESLVDRLLDDPRFGEHWARHWLDVVRFSETKGHVTDQERPYAWKYRDYVIRAFNDDLPLDQFILEHIAGDLLPERIVDGTNQPPTATGILFMHEMHFMAVDPVRQRWDEINAQIDVLSKAFLGLTVECARCHDHKFDAISQQDYYALAGFFQSTEQGKMRVAARANPLGPKVTQAEQAYEEYLAAKIRGRRQAQSPKANDAYFPISEELGVQSPNDTQKLFKLMRAVEQLDPSWSAWVRSAADVEGHDVPLLIRGESNRPAATVPRRFLSALGGAPLPPGDRSGSGRRWLAEQIANEHNPLTARVYVNRLWHHLLGRGIVATPNNFGKLGRLPTHPKLLDYLSLRLLEENWSTKAIIREIVLSATYRRASRPAHESDPTNQWLSHRSIHRLTAEQLRDAMLLVSGEIDDSMYGPGIDCYVPPYATANKPTTIPKSGPLDGDGRRSIYLKIRRNFYDPFLLKFDFPNPARPVGRRDMTIVPSQSLAMMNSPLVHHLAECWGNRIADGVANHDASMDEALDEAYQTAIGRKPGDAERLAMHSLVGEQRPVSRESWKDVAHVLFNHPEFMWIR